MFTSKIKNILLLSGLIGLVSIVITPASMAEQISTPNATISWDENSIYEPVSCSKYNFDITMDASIWQVELSIKNKFGDIVGGGSSQYGNGQLSLQVCARQDLTGTVLVARVITQKVVTSIFEKPIKFISRTTATPTQSAKPSPAPTVTITATPEPAPTVTITSKSQGDAASLQALVDALKNQNLALTAKLKKICSTKPKPKGC
jgi:hypothetical protein